MAAGLTGMDTAAAIEAVAAHTDNALAAFFMGVAWGGMPQFRRARLQWELVNAEKLAILQPASRPPSSAAASTHAPPKHAPRVMLALARERDWTCALAMLRGGIPRGLVMAGSVFAYGILRNAHPASRMYRHYSAYDTERAMRFSGRMIALCDEALACAGVVVPAVCIATRSVKLGAASGILAASIGAIVSFAETYALQ